MSLDSQSSSPGGGDSGKQTFDDARSREELENLQREEEQPVCEPCGAPGDLSPGLLAKGSHEEASEGRFLTAFIRRAEIKSSSRCNSCCSGSTTVSFSLSCKKNPILVLSYCLIHASFPLDL